MKQNCLYKTGKINILLGYKMVPFMNWRAGIPFASLKVYEKTITFFAFPFSTKLSLDEMNHVVIKKNKEKGLLKSMGPGWSWLYTIQFMHHTTKVPCIFVSFLLLEEYEQVLKLLKLKRIKIQEED